VARFLDEPIFQGMAERWHNEDTAMAVAVGVAAPILTLQGIAAVGFTTSGVAAGQSNPSRSLLNSL
jgi:hypothetical protein